MVEITYTIHLEEHDIQVSHSEAVEIWRKLNELFASTHRARKEPIHYDLKEVKEPIFR